ncbi:TetR/AcrR family transcriptional regulator [Neobacillus notoginsengisoli]|uniref:TetR/AcrR family transcriptional regulator n=1 Tax=Neobacillus notoginsengisoli TaxID=1578198 RepID=A0A417YVP2_9BACI|nr:TetR-like C-terminal domain-containing protein [Neobacillus notoginsengisoli]RHW41493.1 TetR/AcrR family transcriptional regulator [Neobacillus notoginsengisoli]
MSPRRKVAVDKEKIILAAVELADGRGFEEVTLANLAKALSIKPPSLYNHIDGLPGVKKELAIYGINELYNALERAIETQREHEPILALSFAYADFAGRRPGIYEATFNAPDPADRDVQAAGSKIVSLVLDSISSYSLGEKEALHAVRGLRSMIHGFCSLEQKGGFGLNLDVNESLAFMVATFLDGLTSKK